MVTQAAQMEATAAAASALVNAYNRLIDEIIQIFEGDDLKALHDECRRLFPPIEEEVPWDAGSFGGQARAAVLAAEAQMGLRKLQGWVQGLIDEQTLSERLRLEAEAKARLETKPPTGFGAT